MRCGPGSKPGVNDENYFGFEKAGGLVRFGEFVRVGGLVRIGGLSCWELSEKRQAFVIFFDKSNR